MGAGQPEQAGAAGESVAEKPEEQPQGVPNGAPEQEKRAPEGRAAAPMGAQQARRADSAVEGVVREEPRTPPWEQLTGWMWH